MKKVAAGGETHQTADKDNKVLTTNQGTSISDNQNRMKSGSWRKFLF